jgi:amylosucrase
MISVRAETPELAGTRLIDFATNNPGVLGYQRPGDGTRVLVLANFSDEPQQLPAVTFSGFSAAAVDLLTEAAVHLTEGLTLAPQQYAWLRVHP